MSGNIARRAFSVHGSVLCLCVSAAVSLGCSTARPQVRAVDGLAMTELNVDTALFAAVVRAASREDLSRTRIDPRPLRSDTAVYIPSEYQPVPEGAQRHPSVFADISPARLQQRREIVRRLGLQETDAAADMKCPGILTPPSRIVDRSACPPVGRFVSVIFSLPRRPNAPDQIRLDSAGLRADRTWIVRSSSRGMSAEGGSTLASDYFVTRESTNQAWRVAKVVGLIYIE